MDLPEELLTMTFSYADLRELDNAGVRKRGETSPIQRIRLTCRRFANVGARVFMPEIKIEYTTRSFARLAAVAGHPLMRAGVRVVDIRTDQYDFEIATNWRLYAMMKLREFDAFAAIGRERGYYVLDSWAFEDHLDAEDDVDIFRATCLLVGEGCSVPLCWKEDYYEPLQEGWLQYQRNMDDQAKLFETEDSPATVIASALARFGGLQGLRLNTHLYSRFPWTTCATMAELALAKREPSLWELPGGHSYIQEQHRLSFFSLFNACARQGVLFRSIDLGLFAASDFSLVSDMSQPMDGVWKVCQDLRHLSFNGVAPGSTPKRFPEALCWPVDATLVEETENSLLELFRGLTHSSNRVQSLEINLFQMGHPKCQKQMTAWLGNRPWNGLRRLTMVNCAIDAPKFVQFLKGLQAPLQLSMGTIYVTEGTWRSILVALNGSYDEISDMWGGELEELELELKEPSPDELPLGRIVRQYLPTWAP